MKYNKDSVFGNFVKKLQKKGYSKKQAEALSVKKVSNLAFRGAKKL